MKLSELEKGHVVMVSPCYGECNSERIKVGAMIVNVLDVSKGLVQIENQSMPPIFAFVDPKNISGIQLNDYVMERIGFSPISGPCPTYNGTFDKAYCQKIDGKLFYVIKLGEAFYLATSPSTPLKNVACVHNLQREIGRCGKNFEVSKNNFANDLS